MMIAIKKKTIVICLVAVCLFLTGCISLSPTPEQNELKYTDQKEQIVHKESEKKDGTKAVNIKAEKIFPPVVETPESSIGDNAQKKEKITLQKKADFEKQRNKRFEKAKIKMNIASGIASDKKVSQKGGISFNFDNADLYEVIRTMAEILGINFIADPNIGGSVTIHTAGELDKSALFPLFFQILELNGLSALKEGNLYRILSSDKIIATPILTRYGRDSIQISNEERMVMQIIPLRYTSPKVVTPTLTPFLSESGTIIQTHDDALFIIIDKFNNLKRILQLIDVLDVDLFDKINHRFFKFHHMESGEAHKLLKGLMQAYLKISETGLDLVNIERLNTLVAISKSDRILDRIGAFVIEIDAPESSADPRIFIYKVKNSDAIDLASLLNQVFVKEDIIPSEKPKESGIKENTKNQKDESASISLFQSNKKKVEKSKPYVPVSSGMGGSASLSGEITIIPDDIRNALIIEAVPSDYIIVKKILEELDVLPRQVLIDVLILDVNITDTQSLGVEWSFLKDRPNGESGLLTANLGSTTKGLTFTAGIKDDWITAVQALATDDKANVLSAPSVLASDNKPATINVVTQIPVTSSTFDTDNGVTTTSVQYRDTGIILTVTPHINDDGMVSMEIEQEVSSVVESSVSESNPSFFNRNVSTSLTVRDNQAIVIGGLISETKSDNVSGVPGLSSLPGIGFLFGNKTDSIIKNELIILISPKVINNLSDIDLVSREFKSKFSDLRDNKRLIDLLAD